MATRLLVVLAALAACAACSNPATGPAPNPNAAVVDIAAPSFGDVKGLDIKKPADTGTGDLAAADTADAGQGADESADGGAVDGNGETGSQTDTAEDSGSEVADDAEPAEAGGEVSGETGQEEDAAVAVDAAKPCAIDSDCEDNNACTTDTCTADGCAWQAKNCDDGLGCTADACDKKTGNCKHKALADTCAIDGACYAAAEFLPTNPCKACDPATSATQWTPQSGASCDDGNNCTGKDQCMAGVCQGVAKPGCCKADSDCAGADACSVAKCDLPTGSCQTSPKTGCCTDGVCCSVAANTISPAGTACGTAVVATQWQCSGQDVQTRAASAGCTGATATSCSELVANWVWGAWLTTKTCGSGEKCQANGTASANCVALAPAGCTSAADCDDSNPCTDDACATGGTCSHLAKKCTAATSCEIAACDAKTGQCTVKIAPGTCEIDGLCMVGGVKKPGDSCYSCQPAASQKDWAVDAACKCTAGVCCTNGVVKPLGSACDTTALATEYGCAADGKATTKRDAWAGCTGPTAQCSTSSTFFAWQPWQNVTTCAATETCVSTDKAVPAACKATDPLCSQADTYEDGTSIATAHDVGSYTDGSPAKALTPLMLLGSPTDVDVIKWTVADTSASFSPQAAVTWSSSQTAKVCLYVACASGSGGKNCQTVTTCPAGTTPATNPAVSGSAVNGCCSTATKGTIALSPVPTTAGFTAYLEVANASPACAQVAVNMTFGTPTTVLCKAGIDNCCEADGTFSAQGKACGTLTVGQEYKCDSPLAGGKILTRKAVSGCTGTSTLCSASSANFSWGAWTTLKSCLPTELCSVTSATTPGTCVPATECAADTKCCTAAGKFAAAGTLCGKSVGIEYQCSGADVQARKEFATCLGGGTTCAGTSTKTPWTTVLTCGANETCTPGPLSSTLPTCVAKPPDLCTIADPWEGVETTATSKNLGTFSDAATAMYIAPKVTLQSATDKDYFMYNITDDKNTEIPEVYVAWVAPKPVTVCAYYRCIKGTNGTNCLDAYCSAGSTPYQNTYVSTSAINGCCKTAATGYITFPPEVSGTDASGTAFINIKNGDPACQQVLVKLAFGGPIPTKCDPYTTCCADNGTFAAAGTACGASSKTQYRCQTVNGISQIQKQTAVGGCSGTSVTCSSATVNWGAWALDTPCMGGEVCAVGASGSAGACIAGKPGSCAGACGGKSADGCYCDTACVSVGDCCKDYTASCGGTCDGACGGAGKLGSCMCDANCAANGNCCLDKAVKCP